VCIVVVAVVVNVAVVDVVAVVVMMELFVTSNHKFFKSNQLSRHFNKLSNKIFSNVLQ